VARWVIQAGHQPRLIRYDNNDRQATLDRIESGDSIADIANETGIDPTTIRAWRRNTNNR